MAKRKPLTYKESKGLARHGGATERKSLAARTDVNPEILYYLADDPEPEVRRQIAVNETAPRQVDIKLARDTDTEVRSGLAGKIARLAPGLTADEQDTIRRMTHEALVILARDEVPRVRRILSEALKDVADAPPDVIGRLARDVDLVVAGPVLEFSPVLTDEDLLEIIAGDPVHGSLAAISRRADVAESVADAISDTDDAEAIAALLANPSTQIREETLDSIIDRAVDVESWHSPLVNRPKLPARAALRLARFVAQSLLQTLTERKDLDTETALAVAAEVRKRLEEEYAAERAAEAVAKLEDESPLDAARRLLEEGQAGPGGRRPDPGIGRRGDGDGGPGGARRPALEGDRKDGADQERQGTGGRGLEGRLTHAAGRADAGQAGQDPAPGRNSGPWRHRLPLERRRIGMAAGFH